MQRQADAQTRPVASLSQGEQARVQSIGGGRGMVQRMHMLGIRPGVDLRVVHGPGHRGAVVMVGGTRLALGRGVIEHILVTISGERRPA